MSIEMPTSAKEKDCEAGDSAREIFKEWFAEYVARTPNVEMIEGFMAAAFFTGMSVGLAFHKDSQNAERLQRELEDMCGGLQTGVQ